MNYPPMKDEHYPPFAPHAVEVFHTTARRRRFMRCLVIFSVLTNIGLVALLAAQSLRLGWCLP